jgi:hypothetical protein
MEDMYMLDPRLRGEGGLDPRLRGEGGMGAALHKSSALIAAVIQHHPGPCRHLDCKASAAADVIAGSISSVDSCRRGGNGVPRSH